MPAYTCTANWVPQRYCCCRSPWSLQHLLVARADAAVATEASAQLWDGSRPPATAAIIALRVDRNNCTPCQRPRREQACSEHAQLGSSHGGEPCFAARARSDAWTSSRPYLDRRDHRPATVTLCEPLVERHVDKLSPLPRPSDGPTNKAFAPRHVLIRAPTARSSRCARRAWKQISTATRDDLLAISAARAEAAGQAQGDSAGAACR